MRGGSKSFSSPLSLSPAHGAEPDDPGTHSSYGSHGAGQASETMPRSTRHAGPERHAARQPGERATNQAAGRLQRTEYGHPPQPDPYAFNRRA
jgi:hypothetical protein